METVEFAIAYCKANTEWIYEDVLNNIPNKIRVKITIISKCGNEADLPNFAEDPRVAQFDIIKLPNVGGCDYAYAHFINKYIETATQEDAASSVIVFMKDTPRAKKHNQSGFRSVREMLKIASDGEFICGIKTDCGFSMYHDTRTLDSFVLESYTRRQDRKRSVKKKDTKDTPSPDFNPFGYKHLGDFHKRALNWTFPNEHVTEVCYGGTFAVPANRIMELAKEPAARQVMMNLEEILTRNVATSIEEHYIERTWAGLLANPLGEKDTDIILDLKESIYINTKRGIVGMIKIRNKTWCKWRFW
jgi:hypothetical protein